MIDSIRKKLKKLLDSTDVDERISRGFNRTFQQPVQNYARGVQQRFNTRNTISSNTGRPVNSPIKNYFDPTKSTNENPGFWSSTNPVAQFMAKPQNYRIPVAETFRATPRKHSNPLQTAGSYIGANAQNLALGVIDETVNIPQRFLEGGNQFASIKRDNAWNDKGRVVSAGAAVALPFLDTVTLGGGMVAKNLLKTGLTNAGKTTLKGSLAKGAFDGGLYGGVYGILQGLVDGKNVDEQILKATQGGVGGVLLGGLLGAGVGGTGNLTGKLWNRIRGVTKEYGVDPKKYIRNELGQFAKGTSQKEKIKSTPAQREVWEKVNRDLGRPLDTPVYYDDVQRAIRKKLGLPEVDDPQAGYIKFGARGKEVGKEIQTKQQQKGQKEMALLEESNQASFPASFEERARRIVSQGTDNPLISTAPNQRAYTPNISQRVKVRPQAEIQKEIKAHNEAVDFFMKDRGFNKATAESYVRELEKSPNGLKSLGFGEGADITNRPILKSPSTSQGVQGYNNLEIANAGATIKIRKAQGRPTGKQSVGSRTNVSSSDSIPNNITGVNKAGMFTRLREVVQDNWIRVKNLQRQKGVKLDEASNPYLKEELYHGRVATRLTEVKDEVKLIDKDLLDTSKKVNLPDKELKSQVNRYLQAKHAPERNAVHGDGAAGITNAEASKVLKEISSSKAGKEVVRLAQKVKDLNNKTLDILYEEQVIDKKMYDTLKSTYKNHVPLNRVLNESDDIVEVLVGKGFNVKGTGIKKAKGSDREVADIMTNVAVNLESAIVRAEKNRVNLATLKFARNNPQIGIFEEIRPRAVGTTFDGKPLVPQVNDPLVLSVRENGKPVYLRIKDEKLAKVFQGVGNEHLPEVFKFIQTFTRFYSGLHTRFNPEFAASNIVRDTQEMAVYMASQKNVGFKGAASAVGRDKSSATAIIDFLRGKDTEGARLYKQMQMDGGTTGGMSLSTRQQVEVDLQAIEKLNRSNPRQAVQKVLEGIDKWNTVFEDTSRLSVYREALSRGYSREAAASLAKNSTVNFNKKGTGGAIINSLYMFANASIQGSTKMLRAMKDPKVATIVTTAVATSTFTVNKWNDSVDPDWRDKVTKWDRSSNMVVMLPSEEGSKYFTIPVSWGLKPLKVASDVAYDLSSGYTDEVGDAAVTIASSAFDAYNPAGGSDPITTLSPTILDTPLEISRNRSWSGSLIKPDWMQGLPQSEQRWEDTDKTLSGKLAVDATTALSENTNRLIDISPNDLLYAYNAYIGGVGKFASRAINTASSLVSGEAPPAKDIPFVNRFFKTRTEEQVQSSIEKTTRDEFIDSLKNYSTGSEEQKEAIKNYLRTLPDNEARQSMLFRLRDLGFTTKGISYSGEKLGSTEDITSGRLYEWIDENGTAQSVNLGKYDKKVTGFEKAELEAEKLKDARSAYKSNLSDEQKQEIFETLGLKEEDIEYDVEANFDTSVKVSYFTERSKELSHDDLINELLEGRTQSLSGDYLANEGTLTELRDAGIITYEEWKMLKNTKIDNSGKVIGSSGKGKKLNITKVPSLNIPKVNYTGSTIKFNVPEFKTISIRSGKNTGRRIPIKKPNVDPRALIKLTA